HFSSSDTNIAAVLPTDYTFTSTDNGVHSLPTGTVTGVHTSDPPVATDKATSSITGSASVTVSPTTANHLAFAQQPSSVVVGTARSEERRVGKECSYQNLVSSNNKDKISLGTNPGGR